MAAAVNEVVPVLVAGQGDDGRGLVIALPCLLILPVTGFTVHVTRNLPVNMTEQLTLVVGQAAKMIELQIKIIPAEVIPNAVAVGN